MRGIVPMVASALIGVAPPAVSQEATGDFTFKRVGVPVDGVPRITVQIDPDEAAVWMAGPAEPVPSADAPEAASVAAAPTAWDWFWDEVSPDLNAAGPANVARALAALETSDGAATPRMQHLQEIAATYGGDILRATLDTQVSPALVLALISIESAGKPTAESSAGAQGLMQLIPATAERFGVADADAPDQNIAGGVAYLDWLLTEFAGDPILALAGYNAGENAVLDNGGVPPFAETRAYVPKVLNAWRVARGLCLTPPELISDGCVFASMGNLTNG